LGVLGALGLAAGLVLLFPVAALAMTVNLGDGIPERFGCGDAVANLARGGAERYGKLVKGDGVYWRVPVSGRSVGDRRTTKGRMATKKHKKHKRRQKAKNRSQKKGIRAELWLCSS
jgi:hypothetical protein